jgi:integrase
MAGVYKRTRNGKDDWVADYNDQHGVRHRLGFPSKKQAERRLVEIQGQVARSIHTPEPGSLTVIEAAKLWLQRCEIERLEKTTQRGYRDTVRNYIATSEIGNVTLAKLTTPMIETWRLWLLEHYTPHLARNILGTLRRTLTEMQRRGIVAYNVAGPVKIEDPWRHRKRVAIGEEIPTKQDVQKLLAASLDPHYAEFRPFLITAVFTGMRISEVRGLAWDGVNFDTRMVKVTQRADAYGILGSPKSYAGQRVIPMGDFLTNTLRTWQSQCRTSDLNLVFPNEAGGTQWYPSLVQRWWHPVQYAAGLIVRGKPKYTFHSLRHYAASVWIEAGFSPKRLQGLLGHSSIQMTFDRYAHLFPNTEDDFTRLARVERDLLEPAPAEPVKPREQMAPRLVVLRRPS